MNQAEEVACNSHTIVDVSSHPLNTSIIPSTCLCDYAHAHRYVVVHTGPRDDVKSAVCRHWMVTVLQPLNEQAAEVIVKRIDLLESDQMSAELLKFVAHVAANRVVLQKWEEGVLEAHSAIPFPDGVTNFIIEQFARMKRKQARMLSVNIRSKL